MNIDRLDALVLCGGLGTRLRPLIADRPKGLAQIGGKPVLDIIVERLIAQGVRRIVFCVGHMKDQILAHFAIRSDNRFGFSEEASPLGTGGALRNALPHVSSDPFLVLNGDSLCDVDVARFLAFHEACGADASLVLTVPGENRDGGLVELDERSRITQFIEKPGCTHTGSYINAGVYLLNARVVAGPAAEFSLERDIFPALAEEGRCYGFPVSGEVVDIGTPERWRRANASPSYR
jgi:NDP-sugar pyrophosphorylase family protein